MLRTFLQSNSTLYRFDQFEAGKPSIELRDIIQQRRIARPHARPIPKISGKPFGDKPTARLQMRSCQFNSPLTDLSLAMQINQKRRAPALLSIWLPIAKVGSNALNRNTSTVIKRLRLSRANR